MTSTKIASAGRGRSNTQQAVDILREMILNNQLAPGSDHLESELADRLNMSRTPIREAALVLEGQGLLEVKPRRGVRILALSHDDMAEIYEILTELESLAAEQAALKGHAAGEFVTAEWALTAMETALEQNDREAWAEADEVFHRELVRLGGNRRIGRIVDMYSDQVRRARAITLYLRPAPTQSNSDHRNVLQAIRCGEANRARELHKAHRVQAKMIIMDLLERYGLHNV